MVWLRHIARTLLKVRQWHSGAVASGYWCNLQEARHWLPALLLFPIVVHGAGPVLVVSAPGIPELSVVVEALRNSSGKTHASTRLPTGLDVRTLLPGQTNDQLARDLQPTLERYSAVFATSLGLARAIQRVNGSIPIVFQGSADPVTVCLVDSMHRPGRNATGFTDYLSDDDAKMMEVLVDGFPTLKTIYVLVASTSHYVPDCGPSARSPKPAQQPCVAGLRVPDEYLEWMQPTRAVLDQGRRLGVRVKFLLLCDEMDFKQLLKVKAKSGDVGFVVASQALFHHHAKSLIAHISASRQPAIFARGSFVRLGGLMALEPVLDAIDSRTPIDMLLAVLDGVSPSSLPIQTPRGFKLTVNASTASAQGLRPSLALLRRANDFLAGDTR